MRNNHIIFEQFGKAYEWNIFVPLTAIFSVVNGVILDFHSDEIIVEDNGNELIHDLIEALKRFDTKGDSVSRLSRIYYELSGESTRDCSFAGKLKDSFAELAKAIVSNSPFCEGKPISANNPMRYYGRYEDNYSYFMPYFSVDDIGLELESSCQTFLGITQVRDLDLIFNTIHYGENNMRVIYGDVVSLWPDIHYSAVISTIPAEMPFEGINRFFKLLLENRTNSEFARIWVKDDSSIITESKDMESMRSWLTESGFLESISGHYDGVTCLSFDFKETHEIINVDLRHVPLAALRAKHYLWGRTFYYLSPEREVKSIPINSVAQLFDGLTEDEVEQLGEENPDLYNHLCVDSEKYHQGFYEAMKPVVSCNFSDLIKPGEEKLEWEHVLHVNSRDIFSGPCILTFLESNPREYRFPIAIVHKIGPFILSKETIRKYGHPICFKPLDNVSLEYLACALMEDTNWASIIRRRERAFMDFGSDILRLEFCQDSNLQQKKVSEKAHNDEKEKLRRQTARIAWISDTPSYSDKLKNEFSHFDIEVVEFFSSNDFSKSKVEHLNNRVGTRIDAIVIESCEFDSLIELRDIVIQDGIKDIPCFLYIPNDIIETDIFRRIFKQWLNEKKVIKNNGQYSENKLASTIRTYLNERSDSKTSSLNVYLQELTVADYINGGSVSRLLMEALANTNDGDYHNMSNTEEHFNTLRKILEGLMKICIDDGFLPELNTGSMASLLSDGSYFDKYTKCGYAYLNGNSPMPYTLGHSFKYLTEILNSGSHTSQNECKLIKVSEYVATTGSDHLFKSAVHILMDIIRWYQNLDDLQPKPTYESINLYEYDGIVRIDENGIPHCGYIKLKGKGLKDGMRIKILGAASNKDEWASSYPLYSNEFKII